MNKPLITIGLTAFNAEATIARALSSALAQTWRPIEIIVVDDASTDSTRSVIDATAARHDNIRVVAKACNSGAAAARNEITDRARGDFVALFDDDDVSLPERIEHQFKRLTEYERDFAQGAPVVCHTAREQIYPDGIRRVEQTIGIAEGRVAPHGLPVARGILMGRARDTYGSCATCSQMARTDVYRMLEGFDPAFRRVDDTEFCVRLALAGGHFPGIAEPLVIQTMTRTADKTLDREELELLALLEKHRDLLEGERMYRFCREWTELKFRWLRGRHAAFFKSLMQLGMKHPLLTLRRLRLALPGVSTNRAFRKFHWGNAG